MPSALEQWLHSGSSFQHNSYSIFYPSTFRKGKSTVLLIHGFPTASYDFAPIWPQLVQKLMLSPVGPVLAKFFSKAKLRASFDGIFGERKASERELEAF